MGLTRRGPSLLRAEGVSKSYDERSIVHDVSLSVEPGEILAILGPNGAGKSTLFRILHLLEAADAGTIRLDGRIVRPGDRAAARRMAGVLQRPYLFDGTVEQNIAYGLRVRRMPRRDRAARTAEVIELLDLMHLARAPAHTLSGGEMQRVALGRALATTPDLLLLDEPTANLDATVRAHFREDLERLVRRQVRGAILITHDPVDAFTLADRIAVMEAGRLVQTATPDTLILDPATPFVATFTGAELILDGVARGQEEGMLHIDVGSHEHRILALPPPAGPLPQFGEAVHVAYRPENVHLAEPGDAVRMSARNRFRLRVTAMKPAGGAVRVRLEGGVRLAALVTRSGARALDLRLGREIEARIKATALRVFPAPRSANAPRPPHPTSAEAPYAPEAGRRVPSGD